MRSRRLLLLASFSAMALAVPVTATAPASDQELSALWREGNLPEMEKLARRGDVRAQNWLGLMLHNRGRYDEAIEWYERALAAGDGGAAKKIAFFHELGVGRPRNKKEALGWHRKGAALGDFYSQVAYGDALRTGEVLERNEREALFWLEKAGAHRGSEQRGYAYLPLAELYADAADVPRDPVRAYAYARAAELTVDDSDVRSSERARTLRKRVASKLTRAELKRGNDLFRVAVADVLKRRARSSAGWLGPLVIMCLLAAFSYAVVKRIRSATKAST